ncbi:MAG: GNAT family N-acetyltransferase [Velocimicrobium sp.]
MEMNQLNIEQRKNIYEEHLVKDFHKDEVKSHERIETLISHDKYMCFGFFEQNQQMGYAYFAKESKGESYLLDYLVVFKEYRSQGVGSLCLDLIKKKLKEEGKLLLAEVENPSFASTMEEEAMRKKRVHFYQKNGFKISKILSRIYNDNYQIIYFTWKDRLTDQVAMEKLWKLYQTIFEDKFIKNNVCVELSE